MYILYVDESGDPGRHEYGSSHYILSGLIVSQNFWQEHLSRLKTFRRYVKETYDLNQRTEIHASELIRINKIKEYQKIKKARRIQLLKDYCTQIPFIFNEGKIINICLNKTEFPNTQEIQKTAWTRLIQRYDNYLKKTVNDKGIIIADDTNGKLIFNLLRKMRVYNPVLSKFTGSPYNVPTDSIIEDLFERHSHDSYFIQSVDVIAHILYRKEYPKGSLRKYGVNHFFDKLEPILLKEASKNDEWGIVRN
ncbi:MAG: DUF3800 domain-containing protein [Marinilabilia sp.]